MCVQALFGIGDKKRSLPSQEQYDKLKGNQVYLTSEQKQVDITSLWGDQDRAVVVFARSMG